MSTASDAAFGVWFRTKTLVCIEEGICSIMFRPGEVTRSDTNQVHRDELQGRFLRISGERLLRISALCFPSDCESRQMTSSIAYVLFGSNGKTRSSHDSPTIYFMPAHSIVVRGGNHGILSVVGRQDGSIGRFGSSSDFSASWMAHLGLGSSRRSVWSSNIAECCERDETTST